MCESEGAAFVVGLIVGAFVGGLVARLTTKNNYELEAVANNCGHYVVNQEGDIVFTWKKEKIDE